MGVRMEPKDTCDSRDVGVEPGDTRRRQTGHA